MNEMFEKMIVESQSLITQGTTIRLKGCIDSQKHRILYFKKACDGHLYIDFVRYNICEHTLYIVPVGHILHLPVSQLHPSLLIEIKTEQLTYLQQLMLLRIKYCEKSFQLHQHENLSGNTYKDAEILFEKLSELFSINSSNSKNISLAKQFIHIINKSVTIPNMSPITTISGQLYISKSTLNRISNEIFGISSKAIFSYHQLVLSITSLLYFPALSIAEIAHKSGFADNTTFCRYIKATTKLSPSQIRAEYTVI